MPTYTINELIRNVNYIPPAKTMMPKKLMKKLGINVVASVYGTMHNRSDGEWHEVFVIPIDGLYLLLDLHTDIYKTSEQILNDIKKAPIQIAS